MDHNIYFVSVIVLAVKTWADVIMVPREPGPDLILANMPTLKRFQK